ncbi:ammonium transporter AmtB-like domain-containing protein [Leptodontidium sp. MPI-SDFR-AT-0119]|nr:ammonium transporter AmtB-like domain-containing protein [Leptodontidium sp. MPI-SDFR-AT-0119]
MASVTLYVSLPSPNVSQVSTAYSNILAHPEQFYQGSDIVWMMISSALVFIMIPALSLIYAGLGNRSFAMTLFRLPLITAAFIGFQWALWGYALTFTQSNLSTSWWGSEMRAFALADVLARPVGSGDGITGTSIPELVYVVYEGMFASFTAAIVCGGTMQRVRPARFLVFISLWSVLVYYPVARWSWYTDGWSKKLGIMDFAGGTPVHIVSGTTVATFSIFCSIEQYKNLKDLKGAVQQVFLDVAESFITPWKERLANSVELYDLLASIIASKRNKHRERPSSHSDGENGDATSEENVNEDCLDHQEAIPQDPEHGVPNSVPNSVRGGEVNDAPDGPPAPRQTSIRPRKSESYSINYVLLGTAILWFGWAGFNGGSALGGNLRAVSAWTSTHAAASSGGTTAVILIWWQKKKARGSNVRAKQPFSNITALYFCDGALAGLVAITPGAGYVPVWSAVIFGAVSTLFVNFFREPARIILKNDPLQIFLLHAGAGVVGMSLTGLFAIQTTIGLDGHSRIPHEGQYTRGQRLGYQLVDSVAGISYTFVVTMLILCFMKLVVHCFASSTSPNDLEDNDPQAVEMHEWV